MERSLLKASLDMHVDYSPRGGFFSNNLRGKNFSYRELGGKPCLHIDMSGNLHVRNKDSDMYMDARQLVERHTLLNHVEFSTVILRKFARLAKATPLVEWILELDFAEAGIFSYSVMTLNQDDVTARFDVRFREKY